MDGNNNSKKGNDSLSSREKVLNADGWERNCIVDEPRLSEIVELHKELGFEVHLEPVSSCLCTEHTCTTCFHENPKRFKIIYIRRPGVSKTF